MKMLRRMGPGNWGGMHQWGRAHDKVDAQREIRTEIVGIQEDEDDYYAAELAADLRSAEDFASDWARRTQSYYSE